MKLLLIESYRKGIALSSLLNVVAKGLLFATNVVIAYYFGTRSSTDVYFFCASSIALFASFLISLNASVLIPESTRLKIQEGEAESMRFLNFFLWVYVAAGAAGSLALWKFHLTIFSAVSRFDAGLLAENSDVLLLSTPLFALILVSSHLTEILNSRRYFTVPMLVSILNSTISLSSVFLFHGKLGVLSILSGMMAAYIAQIAFLIWLMRKALGWRFGFSLFPVGRKTRRNILFSTLGNFSGLVSDMVPSYLMSGMGAGTVSALAYGQKVSALPTVLITGQFSSVTGIKFNEMHSRGDREGLNRVFLQTAKILMFIMLPISALFLAYREEIITVLFKRGAFDAASVDAAALFLGILSLVLVSRAVNTLVARLFMAAQIVRQAFWYQLCMNVALVALIFAGVGLWGPIGYPLGMFAWDAANLFAMRFVVGHFFPYVRYRELLGYLVRLLLINAPLLGGAMLLQRFLAGAPPALSLMAGCLLYGAAIVAANHFLSINADAKRLVSGLLGRAMQRLRADRGILDRRLRNGAL